MIGFIIGLAIGGFIGLFGACLCIAAHEDIDAAQDIEEFRKWREETMGKEEDENVQ